MNSVLRVSFGEDLVAKMSVNIQFWNSFVTFRKASFLSAKGMCFIVQG